jgi:hypothetical protein
LLELPNLPIQEKVGLVDQANDDVRDHLGWPRFNTGPIGLIGRILRRSPARAEEISPLGPVLLPLWKIPCACGGNRGSLYLPCFGMNPPIMALPELHSKGAKVRNRKSHG